MVKLESYRKTRVVSRTLGYGALGLLVSGVFMAYSNNDNLFNIGSTFMGLSVVSYLSWILVYIHNRYKLLKAVLVADKNFDKNKYPIHVEPNLKNLVN